MISPDYCDRIQSVGQIVVYVTPSCPRASMIKGILVSSKKRCEECQSRKNRCQKKSTRKGRDNLNGDEQR